MQNQTVLSTNLVTVVKLLNNLGKKKKTDRPLTVYVSLANRKHGYRLREGQRHGGGAVVQRTIAAGFLERNKRVKLFDND